MKKIIIGAVVIILIGFGVYLFSRGSDDVQNVDNVNQTPIVQNSTDTTAQQPAPVVDETKTVIGKSVSGNEIVAYHFGTGADEILLVGGIHGGYSWNTALLNYQLVDFFEAEENKDEVPENLKLTIIPVLNPDGLAKITGKVGEFKSSDVKVSGEATVPGRFNANNVDLNRNFDCDWSASAKWQTKTVSGGTSAFSEPESWALKNYVESKNPKAVIVYYSAAGGVFASNCYNGVLPETTSLTTVYSEGSGYKAYKEFNFYEITGDMVNWLAKKSIPAISVLLTDHTNTEFSKNIAGVKSVIDYYSK